MVKLPKYIYRWGLHRDILSHSRFSKITRLFVKGPVKTLEIGSGGGVFSVELLERGNCLKVVEKDQETAKRTEEKIRYYFPNSDAEVLMGHANKIELGGPYHQVILLETLEHILDDRDLLHKISSILFPGGRLLISTPTASSGLLRSDFVSPIENGAHVRVGYNGPELDWYLRQAGFITIQREFYGFWFSRLMQEIQRLMNILPTQLKLVTKAVCVLFYRLFSFLDNIVKKYPCGQITLTVKVDNPNVSWQKNKNHKDILCK